jgi:hypothetical protein
MASEGTRQGANHDRKKEAVNKQARLGKSCGMLVSPYRIVVIRDGQFVKAALNRSNGALRIPSSCGSECSQ